LSSHGRGTRRSNISGAAWDGLVLPRPRDETEWRRQDETEWRRQDGTEWRQDETE
jgi:hypothetical protein